MYISRSSIVAVAFAVVAPSLGLAAELEADAPKSCENCVEWSAPREPFRVYGDTYFVGRGLTSILIASKDGHILLDGGLTQSAPQIAASIEKLGLRLEDVKLILNSHTHYDHAGGIAALQRATGATVAASPAAKRALEGGGPTVDDPQVGFGHEQADFPKVAKVREVRDGETLRVGSLEITARFTPGHTPGSTTWTWKSCEQSRCLDVVYADSLNPISAPGFRFTGDNAHASRVQSFETSIATVAALPCDILLTPHPEFFDLEAKLAARSKDSAKNPFIDAGACKAYAEGARVRLQRRVAEEMAAK